MGSSSLLLSFHGLKQAFETDLLSLAGAAALLGVVAHISVFRVVYVEEYLYHFLALGLAGVLSILYGYLSLTTYTLLEVFLRTSVIVLSFNTGLVLSIGVYRLFFHRIRKFPGPFGSKLTRFHDAYLAGKNVQYHEEVAKMHEKYGDFIRTGK